MSSVLTSPAARKRKTATAAKRANGAGGRGALNAAESSEGRSRQLLAAMAAFRDGDFSPRLPTYWPEIDGQIAAMFNQVIAQEARITAEAARLSVSVGREGRQRMPSAAGSVGSWATRVESINTLVRPTAEMRADLAQRTEGRALNA